MSAVWAATATIISRKIEQERKQAEKEFQEQVEREIQEQIIIQQERYKRKNLALAMKYISLGKDNLSQSKLYKAKKCFKSAIKVSKDAFIFLQEAYLELSQVYIKERTPYKALQILDEAYIRTPEKISPRLTRDYCRALKDTIKKNIANIEKNKSVQECEKMTIEISNYSHHMQEMNRRYYKKHILNKERENLILMIQLNQRSSASRFDSFEKFKLSEKIQLLEQDLLFKKVSLDHFSQANILSPLTTEEKLLKNRIVNDMEKRQILLSNLREKYKIKNLNNLVAYAERKMFSIGCKNRKEMRGTMKNINAFTNTTKHIDTVEIKKLHARAAKLQIQHNVIIKQQREHIKQITKYIKKNLKFSARILNRDSFNYFHRNIGLIFSRHNNDDINACLELLTPEQLETFKKGITSIIKKNLQGDSLIPYCLRTAYWSNLSAPNISTDVLTKIKLDVRNYLKKEVEHHKKIIKSTSSSGISLDDIVLKDRTAEIEEISKELVKDFNPSTQNIVNYKTNSKI